MVILEIGALIGLAVIMLGSLAIYLTTKVRWLKVIGFIVFGLSLLALGIFCSFTLTTTVKPPR